MCTGPAPLSRSIGASTLQGMGGGGRRVQREAAMEGYVRHGCRQGEAGWPLLALSKPRRNREAARDAMPAQSLMQGSARAGWRGPLHGNERQRGRERLAGGVQQLLCVRIQQRRGQLSKLQPHSLHVEVLVLHR